ncbi:type II secretion system protein [Stenotrophomonas terrae]|uniref:type II secretion system protein n=1 Tax=Stenotrophomonas terrae TaxID=405446 RepID=UPI00320A0BF4
MSALSPAANTARRQRGFSLLELALVLVILGVIGVILVRWYGNVQQQKQQTHTRSLVQRADDAVLGFAATHQRLPCPASDEQGMEDCAAPATGRLPWKSLGLPDARAGQLAYGVLRYANAAAPQLDADLASLQDRNRPLQMLTGDVATTVALGNVNGLDLCHGLRVAMRLPLNTNHLHSVEDVAGAPRGRNVAYAIATRQPGSSSSIISGKPNGFHSLRRSNDADYLNQIRITGTDQLWARLQCSEPVASVTYSHFNVAAAAKMDAKSMLDLQEQLRILEKLAKVNADFATASVLEGTAGATGASAGIAGALADLAKAAANPELKSPEIFTGNTKLALSIAATVAAATVAIKAGILKSSTDKALKRSQDLYKRIQEPETGLTHLSSELSQDLYVRAVQADGRGMQP